MRFRRNSAHKTGLRPSNARSKGALQKFSRVRQAESLQINFDLRWQPAPATRRMSGWRFVLMKQGLIIAGFAVLSVVGLLGWTRQPATASLTAMPAQYEQGVPSQVYPATTAFYAQ